MNFKIRNWYLRNQKNITWFLIGWMVTSGFRSLIMGDFISAAILFAVAYLNYIMSR